ncbi:MAG: EAL domain-containing protein [Xanthomonadaceae bacterium]|nr:EAL domain-containing protein [Xanthomonadaceae bacterium]
MRSQNSDNCETDVGQDGFLAVAGPLANVLEAAFDAVVIHDCEQILYSNAAAVALFGAEDAADLIGRRVYDRIHPRIRVQVEQKMRELLANNQPLSVSREKLLRLDGTPFDVELNAVPIRYRDHPAVAVIIRDITESQEYREALRYVSGLQQVLVEVSHLFVAAKHEETSQMIETALEQIGRYCDVDRVYVFLFRQGNKFFYCSNAWCRESISCEVRNIENMSIDTVPNIVRNILADQPVSVPRINTLEGEWEPEKQTFSAGSIQSLVVVPIPAGGNILGFIGFDAVRHQRDWNKEEIRLLSVLGDLIGATTRRRRNEQALHEAELEVARMARFDSLTNLPNRILVAEKVEQDLLEACQSGRQLAVVFIDLDFFKKANDFLGHKAGDQILVRAAQRLLTVVGEAGMVARFGGDEFLVIVQGKQPEPSIRLLLEHILDTFRRPFKVQDREILLTASVGVAVGPDDASSASALIRNADIAMHKAKQNGRNSFHFYRGEMDDEIERRVEIEHGLRLALGTDAIFPVFQPIFDAVSRRVVGVEALLRWESPGLGSVSPDEFIPIAEQTGMIHQLGEFVLDFSLPRLALWQRLVKEPLFLAINSSPVQINQPDFCQLIESKLEQYDIPGTALEIEVTEGLVLSVLPHVGKTLNRLRDAGVRLSLDDFGTGYSSLSYLREFKFDTLKIDRSFVQNCTWCSDDGALVKAAIRIARGLGLRMIAEGVEGGDQMEFLCRHRCEMLQGYHLARPMTDDALMRLLRSQGTGDSTTADCGPNKTGAYQSGASAP